MRSSQKTQTTSLVIAATAYQKLATEDSTDTPGEPGETETNASQIPSSARWEGPIGMEDELTGDGRLIEGGALRWADDLSENPIPLRYVREDIGAHDGAVVIGGIDTLERRDGGVIWGSGPLYLDTEDGAAAYTAIKEKRQNGVSMDLDDVSFEVRVAKDVLAAIEAEMEDLLASGDADTENTDETPEEAREYETVASVESDDEIMVTTEARVRSATVVAIPAFANARVGISLNEESGDGEASDGTSETSDTEGEGYATDATADEAEETALVAAGGPVSPPREWFDNPNLTGPTPITVDDDGRIYGHLATWDVCHIASPAGEGVCVTAPHSAKNYERFHTGSIQTSDGQIISVGKITMGTGHAGPRLQAAAAASHYDNTGTAVADVRAGEDAHGIWVAGGARPGLTPKQVRELRASPLSGDWRTVDGNLELHAALAVNVPGFPIPRPAGLVASGEMASLVASGMVPPRKVRVRSKGEELSDSDLAYLKRLANRERIAERNELASRVARSRNEMKVRQFAAARAKTARTK